MTYAVFKNNHIALAGNRYFVANAEVLRFGSIGEKATPLFGQNKLARLSQLDHDFGNFVAA
jgi:hypothetical protein